MASFPKRSGTLTNLNEKNTKNLKNEVDDDDFEKDLLEARQSNKHKQQERLEVEVKEEKKEKVIQIQYYIPVFMDQNFMKMMKIILVFHQIANLARKWPGC